MASDTSYQTASDFLSKRGRKAFIRFCTAVDGNEPFRDIAEEFGMTLGWVSQVASQICPKRHPLAPGAYEAYKFFTEGERYLIAEDDKEIKKHEGSNLVYIQCPDKRTGHHKKKSQPKRAAENTKDDSLPGV